MPCVTLSQAIHSHLLPIWVLHGPTHTFQVNRCQSIPTICLFQLSSTIHFSHHCSQGQHYSYATLQVSNCCHASCPTTFHASLPFTSIWPFSWHNHWVLVDIQGSGMAEYWSHLPSRSTSPMLPQSWYNPWFQWVLFNSFTDYWVLITVLKHQEHSIHLVNTVQCHPVCAHSRACTWCMLSSKNAYCTHFQTDHYWYTQSTSHVKVHLCLLLIMWD